MQPAPSADGLGDITFHSDFTDSVADSTYPWHLFVVKLRRRTT
jgi:hypothetical protein